MAEEYIITIAPHDKNWPLRWEWVVSHIDRGSVLGHDTAVTKVGARWAAKRCADRLANPRTKGTERFTYQPKRSR